MRQFEQLRETWDADVVEPITEFIDAGDRALVRFTYRGVGQGPEWSMEFTCVYTIREGRILVREYFWDHAEALAAVRLSE